MGKIILAGGSGFIGKALAGRFTAQGDKVVILSRRKFEEAEGFTSLLWDGKSLGPWAAVLEGTDLLINLAGKSVNCRYNDRNKKAILDSRIDATRILGKAVQQAKAPPSLWINLSTATIYRHAEDRPMDEESGEIGSGFSVDVATAWEKAFFEDDTLKTRKVALRSAIVLGKGGGVFIPFKNLVKFGLGGIQGSGKQMFSWVHEEDFFEIIRFIQRGSLEGLVNVSSPNPLPNVEVMKVFRAALKMPFGLPSSEWLLRIGAWLIRTEPELLLKSRWILPTRLKNAGYVFKFPEFSEALANLV